MKTIDTRDGWIHSMHQFNKVYLCFPPYFPSGCKIWLWYWKPSLKTRSKTLTARVCNEITIVFFVFCFVLTVLIDCTVYNVVVNQRTVMETLQFIYSTVPILKCREWWLVFSEMKVWGTECALYLCTHSSICLPVTDEINRVYCLEKRSHPPQVAKFSVCDHQQGKCVS